MRKCLFWKENMMSPVGCTYRYDVTMLKSPASCNRDDGSSGGGKEKTAKDVQVWVQPKERFMKLLKSVGAEGPRFTAQEVMSLLIKYISSRRLFDQDDPKKVYCSNDPLGEVFGVKMFTIQDAKRLLFENLIVLQIPGQKPGNPDQNSSCYFTFSHSIKKPNIQDVNNGPMRGACAIKNKDSMDGIGLATVSCTAETSRVPPSSRLTKYGESSKGVSKRERSSSSSTPSSVKKKKQKTRRRRRTKPKVKTQKSGEASKPKSPDKQGSSKKQGGRPWYYIVYTSGEDIQSKSSEVLSVQDNETIEAHNSSDDLWFLEDDFAFEFEVVSSSSGTHSQDQSEDEKSQGSEIIVDVKVVDSGESHLGDYSSTDEEIPEADKWRCTECDTKNTPLCRYCVRCMAVRSGWLPDEQRMTLWERLHNQGHPVKRTMSAPASNKPPLPTSTNQAKTFATSVREASRTSLNATGLPIDVSDGRTNQTGQSRTSHHLLGVHPPPGSQQPVLPQSNPLEMPVNLNSPKTVQRSNLSPQQPSHEGEGIDEGGHSASSQRHGPGSQTTLSHPSDDSNHAQSPLKRPLSISRTREDSGLGVSLKGFSSQGTTTASNSQLPNSQELFQEVGMKRHKSEHPGEPSTAFERGGPPHPQAPLKAPIGVHSQQGSKNTDSKDPLTSKRCHSHRVTPNLQTPSKSGVTHPPGPIGPSSSSTGTKSASVDLCIFCCSRPKTGSIVHGTSGHQVCCYQCAKKLQKRGKPCPACRKPIERIIRNYIL